MNPKNFFFTVAGIAILFFLIFFIFKTCNSGLKEADAKENAENVQLTDARVDRINKVQESVFIQKMVGQPNYNVEVSDIIDGELIKRKIVIPKACFDTIKIGQRVNYLSFSQITEAEANKETPKGWIWTLALICITCLIIGFIVEFIRKAFKGELFFQ